MPKMPNVSKLFGKLCNPAKLYLALSLVSVVIYMFFMTSYGEKLNAVHQMGVDVESHRYLGLLMHVVWAILWTSLLNYICHKFPKHGTTLSWVLVLLPFVCMFLILFFGMFILSHVVATSQMHLQHSSDIHAAQENMNEQLGHVHMNTKKHSSLLEEMKQNTHEVLDDMEQVHQRLEGHSGHADHATPTHPYLEEIPAHDPGTLHAPVGVMDEF